MRMLMKKVLPNRQSIRKKGWDYATPGWYFVTICTKGMTPFFGAVVNGRMVLNEAGKMVRQIWEEIPAFYDGVEIDEGVVMPDHFHGIVRIGQPQGVAIEKESGQPQGVAIGKESGQQQGVARTLSLADVVHDIKSLCTTRYIRGVREEHWREFQGKLWHRNYWDVIVRDERALGNIRRYIRENPRNYEAVMQCGEPRYLGNKTLLDLPKLGFLASRGEKEPHRHLPLRKGEAIISGFLSPMERTVFRAALKHGKPLVWVKPWALEEGTDIPAIQEAIAGGRLLVVSPFSDQVEVPSARRAAWCNQYVLAHCERLVIGHLNPEGMLACILSEADPDLEIIRMNQTQVDDKNPAPGPFEQSGHGPAGLKVRGK